MWLTSIVSPAQACSRAARSAGRPRRPTRRRQARRLTIEQLEERALLSSYSPFPGVVLGSVGATTSDTGRDAFLDHSGRIVVVGQTYTPGTAGERLAMFRFQSTGTPDPTFGSQGVVTTALANASDIYGLAVAPYASKTAGNPPDRILVGGEVVQHKGAQVLGDFFLARYNSNGTLDTTFGNKGIVQTDLGGESDKVVSILVQDDGRIVAVGQSFGPDPYFALARYTAAGRLDTTFGSGGVVKTSIGRMNGAILDQQGKILAVGYYPGQDQAQFVLARYNPDGTPDTGFSGTGIVTTSFDGGAGAYGAAVYPKSNGSYPSDYDGDIVAVGASASNDFNNAVTLARYRPDGSLDTTFGSGGKVVTPNFLGTAAHVAIQSDGKILIGGSAREFKDESGNYLEGFMVARYNFDGTVDTSFGTNGITVTPILTAYSAVAASMSVQPDGKIVLAGEAREGTRRFFAVARYEPDGTLDATFDVGSPPPLPPGITVTPTSELVTTEAGGMASFSVVLNSQPTADVTIQVWSSDTAEGRVSVSSLTFTKDNWNIARTVSVTGVDDAIRDGDKAYSVILGPAVSNDPSYGNLDPSDVSVTNKDNEKGKLTGSVLSPAALIDAALVDLDDIDLLLRT